MVPNLVSVIIPCYNHGRFLPKSIASIQQQAYPAIEIIVVDDGSSDNTKEVAQQYPQVRYIYQTNQGLSAARNTGIAHSKGEFLIFLDADDWLFPGAIETNLAYLRRNEQAAFVSGAHFKMFVDDNEIKEEKVEVEAKHYIQLLRGNYIGVPAAVLYRRWAFTDLLFDLTPPNSCADYDMFLNIARKYPVLHHTKPIAAYRIHASNMSSNIPSMLDTVLKVLRLQKKSLKTAAERKALKQGEDIWKDYYCKELYKKLVTGKLTPSKEIYETLLKFRPKYLVKTLLFDKYHTVRAYLK
ncbi:MAG: family 2 glycosyl transferase [Cytophagales bacterium CG18_big_fil_WC_8_21_14_2_50_42_9]|nr:MAG: family 2 glycosyl transferase [Cytophagales bacterium CG18_big_fil_WC_8_21_14_2_50_42_9]